ncbi:Core-2/I-branching beta-1,6-N-acetylglucosaminyltransferase family protein, partial [Striga asiatica]
MCIHLASGVVWVQKSVCVYVYPPPSSAACYVFSSNGCKAIQNWLPPPPARELTDDEIASRVGHEGKFSVYVHASKDKPVHFSRYFFDREIRSDEVFPNSSVTWGKISMVDAERRLLGNALKDPDNQHFVLLSDSFEDPGPHGSGRYIEYMLPEVEKNDFRKGSQEENIFQTYLWFTMKRQHAIIIMADGLYYSKFRDYCKASSVEVLATFVPGMEGRNCYSDEHYLPTFFYMLDPAGIANWSVTHVDWSEMKWHPKSYQAQPLTSNDFCSLLERACMLPVMKGEIFRFDVACGMEMKDHKLQSIPFSVASNFASTSGNNAVMLVRYEIVKDPTRSLCMMIRFCHPHQYKSASCSIIICHNQPHTKVAPMTTNSINSLQTFCCILASMFLALEARRYSFPTTTAVINPSNNTTKLILPLIHRHAILRPFPNTTTSNSTNHANYNNSLSRDIDVRSLLIPDQEAMGFLVNISIGEPSVPQLLALDSGSSLTWVQPLMCRGCTPAQGPIYDPGASSTYKPLSCASLYQCIQHSEFSNCRKDSRCTYSVDYLDTSHSTGVLALEKFTFVTSEGGTSVISDLAFGYGHESTGNLQRVSGILGLQVLNEHSLVSRLGNRFSYCLGNISDPNYPYSRLALGSGAVIEGFSTPLRFLQDGYVVSLRGISMGGKNLDIFKENGFEYQMLVDTGSTLISLERGAYEEVSGAVGELLDERLSRFGTDRLCYLGDLRRDLEGFPLVTLLLEEGAEVYLGVESIFRRENDEVFCLAMKVAISGNNIIGAYAQQYYNVGFDLDAKR